MDFIFRQRIVRLKLNCHGFDTLRIRKVQDRELEGDSNFRETRELFI